MINLTRVEIEALIDLPQAARAIEEAYRATSLGRVNLPPVGHITFPEQRADCHIKYGHLKGDPNFVIKLATGFPNNAVQGLSTGNGLVLVLSAQTGEVCAILHDEMMLTDVRTGVGGAISSRLLARPDSRRVLILGNGPQARRQIEAHLALLGNDLSFQVWGRAPERVEVLLRDLSGVAEVTPADDLKQASLQADIIVTATGATAPLIAADWVSPGTHITAVGADAPGKQELEIDLIARADVVAVDLVAQCLDHGEISHAAQAGKVTESDLVEIGTLLGDPASGRTNNTQITIADLTGIAAQDIAMANAILAAYHDASQ